MPRGKESTYSEEVAAKICEQMSEGKSLRKICLAEDMPDRSTVERWRDTNPEFNQRYLAAAKDRADFYVDKCHDAVEECDEDNAQSTKVKVSFWQWIIPKLDAKSYGDKVQAEISGKDGGPLQFVVTRAGQRKEQEHGG